MIDKLLVYLVKRAFKPRVSVELRLAETDRSAELVEFDRWWKESGQFVRAGGGNYERSFAWATWRHLRGPGMSYTTIRGKLVREGVVKAVPRAVEAMDDVRLYPLDAELKADKGHKHGSCNRTACQRPGATWYNRVMRAWYCPPCARMINAGDPADPICEYQP
jgi:hypothetical protein